MNAAERQQLNTAIQAGFQKDYLGAVRILTELIASWDAPPEAFLYLGRSYHAVKEYSRALASFNDYIRLKPRSPEGYFFAGRTYLTLGIPHRAVPLLQKALAYNKKDAITMALLGIAYLKAKKNQEAVDMLQLAVQSAAGISPDGEAEQKALSSSMQRRIYRAYLHSLLIWGIRHCRAENYDLGAQALRFVLENGQELIGDMALLRLELGRSCRELGLLEEAVEHYSNALRYAPRDNRIRWYRASILMSLGRNEEAMADIEQIRSTGDELQGIREDLPWNSHLVDFFMLRSFIEAKDWRRAADAAKNWLKSQGNDPIVHSMYAEAQRNLKDYPAAINHLLRALELAPDNRDLYYALIFTSWEGGDYATLGRTLKKAKSLDLDADTIQRFTVLLESKTTGDDQKALELLQQAIRTQGPDSELMYSLGEAYLKVGLLEASINWFNKILLLQADHERAQLGAIAAYEALSKEGVLEAKNALLEAYNRYLGIWPDNRLIRRDRALFYIHAGHMAEAAEELEMLLTWEPANPTLRRVLSYAYRKTGRYSEAAVFLKALLKENPKNLEILLEFSGCLIRTGATPYAAMVLQKALRFFPDSSDVPLALGYLYCQEKKSEAAFDQFREAAARNPQDPRPYHWMSFLARQTGDMESAKKYEMEKKKRSS